MGDNLILTRETLQRLREAGAAWFRSYMDCLAAYEDNRLDIASAVFGGALAFRCGAWPRDADWNRVLLAHHLTAEDLPAVMTWFREARCRCWVEIMPETTTASLCRDLAGAGLGHRAFANDYWAPLAHISPTPFEGAGLELREYEITDREAFIEVYRSAVGAHDPDPSKAGASDDVVRIMAGAEATLAERPEWTTFAALVDGRPAAFACLHVEAGVGSMAGAWTAPAFRGRGCQRALLGTRIESARALGCDLVAGQAAPASASARNQERAGLRLARSIAYWADVKKSA